MVIRIKKTGIFKIMAQASIFACFATMSRAATPITPTQPRKEQITIFVHGIIGLKLSISAYHLFNLVRDKTTNTVYEKTIEGVRNDPFFFGNQPINHVGLQKLDIENLHPGDAAALAGHLYASVEKQTYPSRLRDERSEDSILPVRPEVLRDPKSENQQPTNASHSYYTYGWSGLLSKKARETESEQFLTALENLCTDMRSQNIIPKIKLIGFSHGGNICMQLAHAKNRREKNTDLVIDELILVGTPILKETETALHDPFFKRVYNIYSPGDYVQEKEIFSGEFFAKKAFQETPDAPLPTKLTQIELHVHKDRIKKNRYTKKEKNFGTIDYSPGHMELWFFGWTPNHYRTDYPLHPVPTIVFAPFIINHINALNLNKNNVVLTLHPESNTMKIGTESMPFLTPEILNNLKQTALSYAPKEYSVAEYREHCKKAYWAAREALYVYPGLQAR